MDERCGKPTGSRISHIQEEQNLLSHLHHIKPNDMKHATVLYTCVGLMGAAALTRFIDYSYASKSGLLNSLYTEEPAFAGSTLIEKKTVELEDYSRKAIAEYETPTEEMAVNDDDPKKKKNAKN